MIAQWYVEAGKYDVLPIDGSAVQRLMTERPQIAEARTSYTYWPGTQSVPFFAGPRVLNRPHAITADVDIPAGGAEGVLLCQGSGVGGWSFYLKDGKLHYVHNYVRRALYQVSTPDPVPAGAAPAAVRVRAHRETGHPPRQGRTRPGPALHRQPAGRRRPSSPSPHPSPSTRAA